VKGISTQRYGWSSEPDRPESEKTLEAFLAGAAEAGCDAVESYEPGIGPQLSKHGLVVSGAYVGGMFHGSFESLQVEQQILPTARAVAELGADELVVNCDPKGSWGQRERKTADEIRRQGENLTTLAEMIAPLGLRLAMHNHANQLDLHLDDLRAVTEFSGEAVGVCLDIGWALTSEDDPVARAEALGSRLTALHVRNQVGPQPTEWLGEGDIDISALVGVLRGQGYANWLTLEIYYPQGMVRTASIVENYRRSVSLLRRLWEEA